jgi:hypothetical protein
MAKNESLGGFDLEKPLDTQIRQRFDFFIDVYDQKGPRPDHQMRRALVDLQNDICTLIDALSKL